MFVSSSSRSYPSMPGGFYHTEVRFQPVDFTSTEVVDPSMVPPLPKQWIHRWLPIPPKRSISPSDSISCRSIRFPPGVLFTEVSISPVASYPAEAFNFTVGFHLMPKHSISSWCHCCRSFSFTVVARLPERPVAALLERFPNRSPAVTRRPPHHSTGAAKAPKGGVFDKSFGIITLFRVEGCPYQPLFPLH